MGIKNLHKFLQKHIPDYSREVHLSEYKGKKIAIDIYIYLFSYKSNYKDNWCRYFVDFLIVLLHYEIQCIFIYDSGSPIEKQETKDERKLRKQNAINDIQEIEHAQEVYKNTGEILPVLQNIILNDNTRIKKLLPTHNEQVLIYNEQSIEKRLNTLRRNNVSITKEDLQISKKILDFFDITYCKAENEGETLCAHLCIKGIVDCVLTDDTDVLAYGTPVFLTKLDLFGKNKFNKQRTAETVMEIRFDHILESIDFTLQQFKDLCILCGTDYNKNIYRIGHEKAFKLLKKYNTIEGITENTKHDTSILNYKRTRELFNTPETIESIPIIKVGQIPSLNDINLFAFEHNFKCSRLIESFIN